MKPFQSILEAITIGANQIFGNLHLTPLIARPQMPTCPPYKSLDAGLSDGTVVILETSEVGSVPSLPANNSSNDPVLILAPELVKAIVALLSRLPVIAVSENAICSPQRPCNAN